MLTQRTRLTVALVFGLSVSLGGCSAGPPVEQEVAGTETLVLHVGGMT